MMHSEAEESPVTDIDSCQMQSLAALPEQRCNDCHFPEKLHKLTTQAPVITV